MESIKELREVLQAKKVNPVGWRRPWGYKTFQRGPSIYITRILLNTRVTPTYVTIAGILIGLAGCFFLLSLEWYIKLLGLFLLYLNILSDKVDGEIARYKKIYDLQGLYWDEINHLVIPALAWLALAFGVVPLSQFLDIGLWFFGAGILGALALMTIRVTHSLAPQIYGKKYLKYKELYPQIQNSMTDIEPPKKSASFFRTLIRAVHELQDFFIVIAAAGFIVIIEQAFFRDSIFHPILANYILFMSALFILFAIENIIKKSFSLESDIERITQIGK